MLPKTILCLRHGLAKANEATAAFTLDRLARWEAGERASLWSDISAASTRSKSRGTDTYDQKQMRSEPFACEGLDGKACSALLSKGLVTPTAEAARKMRALHPAGALPPCAAADSLALPPQLAPALVEKTLRSFGPGTSPGPTGLRIQHLLDACTLSSKAAVIEQLTQVVSILARGQAPLEVAPDLAGAMLLASLKKQGGM